MFKHKQRGFILIELLLALLLVSLVLVIGWNAFGYGQNAWQNYLAKQEAEEAVRYTSQVISNQLNYASLLEIRKKANTWSSTDLEDKDRVLYVNNTGDSIILEQYDGGGHDDVEIAHTERSTLEFSFSKPINNDDGSYIANNLIFRITARSKTRDGEDENGDGVVEKAVIYSSESSIMISNMMAGYGIPIDDKSLYSKSTNGTPGDRIRYRTTVDRYDPSAPGGGYTCGL